MLRHDGLLELRPTEDGIGDSGPDVLVGDVPVVCVDDDGLRTEWITLPTVQPFAPGDVWKMWEALGRADLPLPTGITGQGRVTPGDLAGLRNAGVALDFVASAHASARRLLAEWPTAETTTRVWRPLEIPRGREDEIVTDRRAGQFPALAGEDGALRPAVTARTVSDIEPWCSSGLAEAARELASRLSACVTSIRRFLLVGLFLVLKAGQERDKPLSTWPPNALAARLRFGQR